MRWEARTAFRVIEVGTRLCVYQTPQIRGEDPPVMLGDHPLMIQLGTHDWVDAEVRSATPAAAVLVMPDGVQYQMTPRREGEPDSAITMQRMYWTDWIVRSQVVP